MSLANEHGRLFEYMIIDQIVAEDIPITTSTHKAWKQRGTISGDSLSTIMADGAQILVKYLKTTFEKITYCRLVSDHHGTKGNSEDFVLRTSKGSVKISLKFNNQSIKHQRPASTATHLGLTQNKCDQFKAKYKAINDTFYGKYSHYSTFATFKKNHDIQLLYDPMIDLVTQYLKKYSENEINVGIFYRNIFGDPDTYLFGLDKIKKVVKILAPKRVNIPTTMKLTSQGQYIYIRFNNGVRLTMRLHTASSRLTKSLSLKFDSTSENLHEELQVINIYPSPVSTLLRYPGGKSRAVKILSEYIPKDVKTVVSPFFGGGSFELHLANRGYKIIGYDLFEPLVAFWNYVLKDPLKLATNVQYYHPLTREVFQQLQEELREGLSEEDMATNFFCVNRSSFSGTTLSGGFSQQAADGRFTQSSIDRIKDFNCPNLQSVSLLSFHESIKQHPNDFLYCDPPYHLGKDSKLYGTRGDLHESFDHKGLCKLLKKHPRWICSYNDRPEIREMYSDFEIVELNWSYGMATKKKNTEILILNV